MSPSQSEGKLVFVPLSGELLAGFATQGNLEGPLPAFTVTDEMLDAFGLRVEDGEQAEFTAVNIAAIAGLLSFGVRLVAVLPASYVGGCDDFGTVSASGLKYSQVVSLFADEPAGERVALIAQQLKGRTLDEVWEDPIVIELVDDAELLWYGPAEWKQLVHLLG
ncbi:MAG: hypothetical protein LBU38_04660 [Propionibacteriaceae bacterium]|jgi:hypothetical protein|nr:hypothetical protein [Propionibacteriaceae bacterium]